MGFAPLLTETERAGIPMVLDEASAERGLLVAFTRRAGGVSPAPYESLNLGTRVGDDPVAVAENRRRAARAMGFDPAHLASSHQVHGRAVVSAGQDARGDLGEADIITVRDTDALAMILTADCVPVVIAGTDAVAAVHAGWRGIARGAVEEGLARVGRPLVAWIGPSIRACCYEVGPEVVAAFAAKDLPSARAGRVDPADAALRLLERSGVDRVAVADVCTSCDRRYFSHRRDGVTGRQGAFASWLHPPERFAEAAR
ncbi:MAG: polyphenol oxidase family protein [Actinomycetota bacterium]|nr:polyphenol oxidase family protein [Actinomycetota bacterium]